MNISRSFSPGAHGVSNLNHGLRFPHVIYIRRGPSLMSVPDLHVITTTTATSAGGEPLGFASTTSASVLGMDADAVEPPRSSRDCRNKCSCGNASLNGVCECLLTRPQNWLAQGWQYSLIAEGPGLNKCNLATLGAGNVT
ncbi:hypothetical protein MLD38_015500 [Melastoma candidum]|uniref:Uncharacterized protein n=1 Tax=Melastoma candidum TaxID=119954 RepID=A0ACB9RGC6_9MYRT|nr:hypothetical protein MLD38_015500 [Melastoma candidum]